MAKLKDFSLRTGRYTCEAAKIVRAFTNFRRYRRDPKGVLRHLSGYESGTLFGYIPEKPAYGLKLVKNDVWTFMRNIEVLTDAVDAVRYSWREQTNCAGTPLALCNERTGCARFITQGVSGCYYSYQGQTVFQVVAGKGIWSEWEIKVSDPTNITLFLGLSALVTPPGILPDARVNSIGFRKDNGDAYLDAECVAAGVTTEALAVATLEADTYITLGFQYNARSGIAYFYVNDDFTMRVEGLPSVLMALSFGMRSYSGTEKSMTVKKIVGSIET